MRLITPNLWNFQRVLHTLAATQEVLRHTRLHSRGSTRVPPTSRGAPFLPLSSRGGILSVCCLDRIHRVPVAIQEEALSTGKARGTPVSCHHSQSPPDVTVHSRETCFPALPRLSSRGSTHTTVARGTALWESLVGKPRGKATGPLIHVKGSMTLLLQLGRKAHVMAPLETSTDTPGETPEVPQDPCQHWRGILMFRKRIHTRS